MAITKTDVFDFLIDIVPREDMKPMKKDGVQLPSLPKGNKSKNNLTPPFFSLLGLDGC